MSSTTNKPTDVQLLVDLQYHIKKLFAGDEGKILEFLSTSNEELEGLAPVELIAVGKVEHLLAYVLKKSEGS